MIISLNQLIDHPATLEEPIASLSTYRDRDTKYLPVNVYEHLEQLRKAAVECADQDLAKAVWCLETIGRSQDHFIKAFCLCKEDHFYKAWCELEHCELGLRSLRRHCEVDKDIFGINHMLSHVPRFQDLFPYKSFISPAYVIQESKCSICNSLFGLRSGCNHEIGEIYDGKMCLRIITRVKPLEISIVDNPVQKYSVLFINGGYNYGAIYYTIQRLASPWHSWTYEKVEATTGIPLYAGIGRNNLCPCGSGLKFKRCCINKMRTHDHYQIHFEIQPPVELPDYVNVENARYIVDDRPIG